MTLTTVGAHTLRKEVRDIIAGHGAGYTHEIDKRTAEVLEAFEAWLTRRNRESGDSLPAEMEEEAQKFGRALAVLGLDSPVLNKSGGSPAHAMGVNKGGGGSVLPPCPHSGVIIQVPQLGDGRLTGRYDRTCADCGAVIERGAAAR